jgi:hypothetical protein
MNETVATAVNLAADHPLIALALLVFVALPLLNGWMHEGRFFGECLIVGIRFFKHEVSLWRGFLGRLKCELTSWESSDQAFPAGGSSAIPPPQQLLHNRSDETETSRAS